MSFWITLPTGHRGTKKPRVLNSVIKLHVYTCFSMLMSSFSFLVNERVKKVNLKNMKRNLEVVDDVLINKIRLTNNTRSAYFSSPFLWWQTRWPNGFGEGSVGLLYSMARHFFLTAYLVTNVTQQNVGTNLSSLGPTDWWWIVFVPKKLTK